MFIRNDGIDDFVDLGTESVPSSIFKEFDRIYDWISLLVFQWILPVILMGFIKMLAIFIQFSICFDPFEDAQPHHFPVFFFAIVILKKLRNEHAKLIILPVPVLRTLEQFTVATS